MGRRTKLVEHTIPGTGRILWEEKDKARQVIDEILSQNARLHYIRIELGKPVVYGALEDVWTSGM